MVKVLFCAKERPHGEVATRRSAKPLLGGCNSHCGLMESPKESFPKASLVFGKDLSPHDLSVINAHRFAAFRSTNPIAPTEDNEDWNKPYFIVRQGNEIVAFGRLHDVEAEFAGKKFEILGIATIVAVEKGKGNGSAITKSMTDYVQKSGKTAIGFCRPSQSPFYEKNGFGIIPGGVRQFSFMDDGSESGPRNEDDDVIYLEGTDGLMHQLQERSTEKITVNRKTW